MRSPTSPLPHALIAAWTLSLAACGSSDFDVEDLRALGEFQDGLATYYTEANGGGHCSFDPTPNDLLVAAMNTPQYANSAVCGACAEVEGPQGTVRVRIVDSCPGCGEGHLDLSPMAFEKISPLIAGRVKTRWRLISCPVEGPLRYRFKEGSTQWWTAIQVRNHRLPIAKLEWMKGDKWVAMKREHYNYFVEPSGMGTGPVRLRVTALDGQTREDTLPRIEAEKTFDGAGQFNAQ